MYIENIGEGKKLLVTGGSRGIGRGIALLAAAQGYDLAITHYMDDEEAEKVAHLIENDYGRQCVVFAGDLAEQDTAGQIVADAIAALGRIDVLVNNAGVTIMSKMTEMDPDKINYLFHLNFRAPMLTMQAAGKHMIKQGIKGSIVNITSTRGERAYPLDAIYGGMKAALTRASQSIALEMAPHHIRVNCVAPGATRVRDTQIDFYKKLSQKIPLAREGEPADIASAVLWLASDQASYITGVNLRVDGGLILPGMPEDVSAEAGYGWGKITD